MSVDKKPRTETSLGLPFLLGRRLAGSTSGVISGSDTDLLHVPLQVASPAKWAVTVLFPT